MTANNTGYITALTSPRSTASTSDKMTRLTTGSTATRARTAQLLAAAAEGWVLEDRLLREPLELEVLTAPRASVAAAGGRDAPNEHQSDRIVCEGGQAPSRRGLRN